MRRLVRFAAAAIAAAALISASPLRVTRLHAQSLDQTQQDDDASKKDKGKGSPWDTEKEILLTLVRLPVGAALGAALAFRPRRRGTPARQPAVIQTQIILAIVGSVVMMIVGSNLARAFGIVGAAGLVRYRAKIEDPKDAGVMLTTLAAGLATGVGLYAVAVTSTLFILATLWVLESFEPRTRKLFDLTIKMGDETDEKRPEIEAILRRYHVDFELRSSADEEISYEAYVPLELQRDRVTNAILKLDPDGHAAVQWSEKKSKAK